MPLPLWAIGAGIKAGTSAWKWWQRRKDIRGLPKRPGFEGSSYAERLKQLSEQGIYSPAAMQNILGGVSRTAAGVAEEGKAGYYGRMIGRGMGGSIATQAGMGRYDIARMGKVSETARRLATEGELSKVGYGLQYGQMSYKDRMAKYAEDLRRKEMQSANVQGLIGGLGETVGTGFGTYAGALKEREQTIGGLMEKGYKGLTPREATSLAELKLKMSKLQKTPSYQAAVSRYTESKDTGQFFYDLKQLGLDKDTVLTIMEQLAFSSQTQGQPYTSPMNLSPVRSPLQ